MKDDVERRKRERGEKRTTSKKRKEDKVEGERKKKKRKKKKKRIVDLLQLSPEWNTIDRSTLVQMVKSDTDLEGNTAR